MNNNKYGWLSIKERAARQSQGFFVDENNQIIYWLNKYYGFYITKDEVTEVILNRRYRLRYCMSSVALLILLAFLLSYVFSFLNIPQHLPKTLLVLSILRVCIEFVKSYIEKNEQIKILNTTHVKANLLRPKPEHLKLSYYKEKAGVYLPICAALLLATFFGLLTLAFENFVLLSISVLLFYLAYYIYSWEKNGLLPEDIRLLDEKSRAELETKLSELIDARPELSKPFFKRELAIYTEYSWVGIIVLLFFLVI